MKTIHKYKVNNGIDSVVTMPKDSKVINVSGQNGEVYIWAMVDTNNTDEHRYFMIYGTGWDLEQQPNQFHTTYPHTMYIGTAHVDGYVWHVFEGML